MPDKVVNTDVNQLCIVTYKAAFFLFTFYERFYKKKENFLFLYSKIQFSYCIFFYMLSVYGEPIVPFPPVSFTVDFKYRAGRTALTKLTGIPASRPPSA